MNNHNIDLPKIRPQLIERAGGWWLAVTPHNAKLCFGVMAQTENQAREEFSRALERWVENLGGEQAKTFP